MTSGKPKYGLARVLSKMGICSRTQAIAMVNAGRIAVNGRVQINPEYPTDAAHEQITIDGAPVIAANRVYLALNKPRGLIVSTNDERHRDTVYALLNSTELPWLSPVGRLDKASEGLLLLTNDSVWAARITNPDSGLNKIYHVQVNGIPTPSILNAMRAGIRDEEEMLSVVDARLLRAGEKNAWLEVVLNEGRNRHIRRLLKALNYDVLRLVRIAIGNISLGELAKGSWRHLTTNEVQSINARRAHDVVS